MSATHSSTERRAHRISAAVLIVACTLVALSCVQSAYRLWLPTEGWNYTDSARSNASELVFSQNLLGEPTPIRAGDELLAINGVPFLGGELWRETSLDSQLRSDAVARYTVQRDGQVLDLAVPLKRWTLAGVMAVRFADLGQIIGYTASWLLLGLSIFVLRRRPADASARALLLFVAASLVPTVALVPDGATTRFSVIWPLTAFLSYLIWAILLTPSLLALALTFPQPKRIIQRAPWLLVLPYTIFWLLLAILGPNFVVIGFGLSGVFFVLSLLAVLHATVTQRDNVSRAQLLWGLGGFLALLLCYMPFFATVFLTIVGIQLDLSSLPMQLVGVLASFGFPLFQIMLAVAILRYRLFDIEIIIRRTLLYAALTLTLGATYFIGVVLLQALFVRLTGQESALAVVASTLVIAALFGPLRRRVQAIIDRRFFRRKYDAQQVLAQFALRAQQQADLDTLAGDILQVVQETVQPDAAQVWLIPNKERS